MWIKKGNIFNKHHAQLPVVDTYNDFYRIYYSTRINGKSVPLFIDVDKKDPSKIIYKKPDLFPILQLGKPGSFDHDGIMPTEIITVSPGCKFLYYVGWSKRKDVPYHNSLGLAISYDDGNSWYKFSEGYGPILSNSFKEEGFIGTVGILREKVDFWRMWYSSCKWEKINGKFEPIYGIKLAISKDGIHWQTHNHMSLSLEEDEGGISSARIYKTNEDIYVMYFSVRKQSDYRTNPNNTYRIQCATSSDGRFWDRDFQNVIELGNDGWDSEMTAYPYIINDKFGKRMFYNGNGFGKTGIGYCNYE